MHSVWCVLTKFKSKVFSIALFLHFSVVNKEPEQCLLTETDLCIPVVTKCVHSAHTSMVMPSFINLSIINIKREYVLIGLGWEE